MSQRLRYIFKKNVNMPQTEFSSSLLCGEKKKINYSFPCPHGKSTGLFGTDPGLHLIFCSLIWIVSPISQIFSAIIQSPLSTSLPPSLTQTSWKRKKKAVTTNELFWDNKMTMHIFNVLSQDLAMGDQDIGKIIYI